MNENNVEAASSPQNQNQKTLSFISLGGLEDVTRNMYLYEYNNQILIVDCGLGFPDETMLGVDLLLPDISYLLDAIQNGGKKIVGMILSHGHEDHIGGLPFIMPQLPQFPIYASPFTANLTNDKLVDFRLKPVVNIVNFDDKEIELGDFKVSFIRVTHSVPDTANIFIETPAGNFFHGSDYKIDLTPADGKRTDFQKIMKAAEKGILGLMADSLGSDRPGHTPSEEGLDNNFEREMRECTGKFIVTTYSSNIARLNQIIKAADRVGRKICFVGRSVLKLKQLGERMHYLQIKAGMEVPIANLAQYKNNQVVLVVAGSQGQENSAMSRIANNEHKEIKIDPFDVVVFSSDAIPGNEVNVNNLIDTLSKRGAVIHRNNPGTHQFHVSGHGSADDHQMLIALTQPKYMVPISGNYVHMVAYRDLAMKMGYNRKQIFLVENGQEVLLSQNNAKFGKKVAVKNVFVDEVSGEEVESFVVRDRERLGHEGIVIALAEISALDGQLVSEPEIIMRGSSLGEGKQISAALRSEIDKMLRQKKEKVKNWVHIRRTIGDIVGRFLYKKYHTRPLVLPVVIEV
jgi:ribonuclease J